MKYFILHQEQVKRKISMQLTLIRMAGDGYHFRNLTRYNLKWAEVTLFQKFMCSLSNVLELRYVKSIFVDNVDLGGFSIHKISAYAILY